MDMSERLYLNFEELEKKLPEITGAGWTREMLDECVRAGLLPAEPDGEGGENFYCVESAKGLLEMRRVRLERRDKYLVCKSCKKALCVSAPPHANVLLLYLYDHEGCELVYVPENNPVMDGCDVFLEYDFANPRPAFHLPLEKPAP